MKERKQGKERMERGKEKRVETGREGVRVEKRERQNKGGSVWRTGD